MLDHPTAGRAVALECLAAVRAAEEDRKDLAAAVGAESSNRCAAWPAANEQPDAEAQQGQDQ